MQLIIQRGYELGRIYNISAPKLVIGSEPSVLVPINDTAVAPYHAGLSVNNRAIFIEDLNSSGGTFVNNNRIIQPTMLKPGDYIQVGTTILSLQAEYVNLRPDSLADPRFQKQGFPDRFYNPVSNSPVNQVAARPGNVGGVAGATPQVEQKLGPIKIGNKLKIVGIDHLTVLSEIRHTFNLG